MVEQWNSKTSDDGIVEERWWNSRRFDGVVVEHLMVEQLWWNCGTEMVEQ